MNNIILLLITVIIFITIYIVIKIKQSNEYFYEDEIDFSDPSQFIETRSQLTPQEIKQKKELRQQLSNQSADDDEIDFSDPSQFIESRTQLTPQEIQQKKELRQQHSQMHQTQLQPSTELLTECKTKCDCCWKNKSSNDRITACNKKYKTGSKELMECMNSNSKYAHEACKSLYGKGLIFKTC